MNSDARLWPLALVVAVIVPLAFSRPIDDGGTPRAQFIFCLVVWAITFQAALNFANS